MKSTLQKHLNMFEVLTEEHARTLNKIVNAQLGETGIPLFAVTCIEGLVVTSNFINKSEGSFALHLETVDKSKFGISKKTITEKVVSYETTGLRSFNIYPLTHSNEIDIFEDDEVITDVALFIQKIMEEYYS